jgi:phosphatidyl-myo-inositol dimannoside synthase
MCRLAGMAIYKYNKRSQGHFKLYSMYDEKKLKSEPYLPAMTCKGFAGARWWFYIKTLLKGVKSRVVVLSHINFLPAGYLIKFLSPKTKIVLIAHGTEVWKNLSLRRKKMLKHIDLFIPVNALTKEKIKGLLDLPEEKFRVVHNCLDPFLPAAAAASRRNECRSSLGIDEHDFVLMSLSHLSSKEKSRNYDTVLIALKKLQSSFRNIKYLFVGKYDADEKKRLDRVIHDLGIEDFVIFTGFVPDAVLPDFYNMADVYIMPVEKEGFGFPFINALFYNKPVIAGRIDAVTSGEYGNSLGTLVDLHSKEEIVNTIRKVVTDIKAFMPDRKLLMAKFSYPVYKENWKKVLDELVVQRN